MCIWVKAPNFTKVFQISVIISRYILDFFLIKYCVFILEGFRYIFVCVVFDWEFEDSRIFA